MTLLALARYMASFLIILLLLLFYFFWKQGEIDLLSALSKLTILTASRCLHGDDVRENLFEEVARLFHDLDEGMTPLSVFLPHAPVPAHFRRDKVRLT